jgi:CubicO group peptidase (beta-lactamase class C family)
MKHCLSLITAVILLTHTTTAQEKKIIQLNGTRIPVTTIDNIVSDLMEKAAVTGLNLGIINNNQVTYIKSYGSKNIEKGQKIDTATIFYSASFSKAVFAYLVMQLVDEKKLDLDRPVYEYLDKPLPEYVDYKDLAGDDRWKLITARHCLSHTTGFPNWRFLNPKGNKKLEFFFTPGTRYAYSGEGLVLLQLAIEKITGRKLEELAQEKVFRPIGMTRTSYIWQPAFEDNYAIGYDEDGKALPKRKRPNANAAGSMETTIADYSRFIAAVMQGRGLSKKSKDEMLSPQVRINSKGQFPSLRTDTTNDNKKIQLSYGLGWGVLTSNYGKAFFKEGHDDGWEHYNINFPGKKISILIMTNSSNGESILKELLEKVIGDTFTPWQWENYTPYRNATTIEPALLNDYVGFFRGKEANVNIFVEDGVLKLDVKEEGLVKVKLYAESKDHFFTKIANLKVDFIRDDSNKVYKIIADDGSEKYEFTKTNGQ